MRVPTPILVAIVLTPILLGLSVWAFFASHDPMLLIFGLFLTFITWIVALVVWAVRRGRASASA